MPIDLSLASEAEPGRLGRHDVVGVLGKGGMGTVFLAVDREHGQRVALKTLTHLGPEGLLRFKTEFRSVAGLAHPNLVPLYELGCEDGVWYFTMERVDGTDFLTYVGAAGARDAETVVARKPPLSVPSTDRPAAGVVSIERVRTALRGVVLGVHALHEAGWLHLDLKPSNVLVDANGRVVVLDFGLVRPIDSARVIGGLGESGSISGTPQWMAPEQYSNDGVGEAADWYAVGLMLYRALAGVTAFPSASVPHLWYAKLFLPPTPPHELAPGVAPDLSALAMALLHPDPASRPTGATLAAFVTGEISSAALGPRTTSLVGRDTERGLLRAAIGHARAGKTAVVHVRGPSGHGKSALLGALVDEAQAGGEAVVLRGRCYERENVPYNALDGALDDLAVLLAARPDVVPPLPDWIAELVSVFPVLDSVPSIAARTSAPKPGVSALELRRRAIEALRELVTSLAARSPVVLLVDDLQWADADSVHLLSKLLEAPAPSGLVLAASHRPLEPAESARLARHFAVLRQLDEAEEIRWTEIDVERLSPAAAEALAKTTLEAAAGPVALASLIAHEADGVPFFVEELARSVAEAARGSEVPSFSITTVLARRTAALGPRERAVIEVLAVAESPIPLSAAFAVAGLDRVELRVLWSLRVGQYARAAGTAGTDRVELVHDRLRDAIFAELPEARRVELHAAIGRALSERGEAWLAEAVRHLHAGVARLAPAERRWTARLDLDAGRAARRAAAFPLALARFQGGISLLGEDVWETEPSAVPGDARHPPPDHELALALHLGAAEAAYLASAWGELDPLIRTAKARARSVLEGLVAWEVEIDAHIARNEYDLAVTAGLGALALLGVELPADPSDADVGAEVRAAMEALAPIGPDGIGERPLATAPEVLAAMRLETRISSAAYFARPKLLAILACRLVTTSIAHGLSHATPYALTIHGVVLHSIGMHAEAHRWGRAALALIERFEDRSLEARTRHVAHDLVCVWTVPLASTLDDLRRVVDVGRSTGDLEYAAYAAHGYVHNAFYAGRDLDVLHGEALAYGAFMRGHEQVNAFHVHRPFEQLLRAFTGRARDPSRLDGAEFDEAAALAAAEAAGSRSAQCLVRFLMGLVRYHFGDVREASAQLEAARPYLDGLVSTWHVPMFHQYAALAIHGLPANERATLRGEAEASLGALRALAQAGPENFRHRVRLIEGEAARVDRDVDGARLALREAATMAAAGGWLGDEGLARELRARTFEGAERTREMAAARAIYERWGARAKVARLDP